MDHISVDAGGVFIGDQSQLPENIDQNDVFKKLFGSPMRRLQTISNGFGCIIDTDDDVLDVVLCEHREIQASDAMAVFSFYLIVRSGVLTVCSVDCLVSRCEQESSLGKIIKYEISQGTYAAQAICGVVPSHRAEWGVSSVVDTAQESAFFTARREWVFGSMKRSDYEKVVSEYEAAKLWYKPRIELSLLSVEGIPAGWEPVDSIFEYKPSRADVYAFLTKDSG